jgi:hypothetical protein
MRTAYLCAESIKSAFPCADFFIHAVADDDAQDAELFDPLRLVIEPQHEMPERRQYTQQCGRGCHGVQRVLKQLWGLKRVWQIYARSGKSHDWIVRCRADVEFTQFPEGEESRHGEIMIPRFCNYFGLNDRFAMMLSSVAEKYFARIDLLDTFIDAAGTFHPETFLAWAMTGTQINRTQALFETVRKDGTRDKPEGKTEWGDVV